MTATPGPWRVEDRRLTHPQTGSKSGGDGLLIMAQHAGEGSSFCVATVNSWGGGNEADAALLAAAPEMLDALKHARTCVPFPSDAHAKIVAAIEKATGQ